MPKVFIITTAKQSVGSVQSISAIMCNAVSLSLLKAPEAARGKQMEDLSRRMMFKINRINKEVRWKAENMQLRVICHSLLCSTTEGIPELAGKELQLTMK